MADFYSNADAQIALGGGVPGPQTLLDFDFTTQANQDLKAGGDGYATIGTTDAFRVRDSANATSMDVTNGTGAVTVSNGSFPGLELGIQQLLADWDGQEALRIMVKNSGYTTSVRQYFGISDATGTGGGCWVQVEPDGAGDLRSRVNSTTASFTTGGAYGGATTVMPDTWIMDLTGSSIHVYMITSWDWGANGYPEPDDGNLVGVAAWDLHAPGTVATPAVMYTGDPRVTLFLVEGSGQTVTLERVVVVQLTGDGTV